MSIGEADSIRESMAKSKKCEFLSLRHAENDSYSNMLHIEYNQYIPSLCHDEPYLTENVSSGDRQACALHAHFAEAYLQYIHFF